MHYIVANYGGTLSLIDNCFYSNSAVMAPVLSTMGDIKASNNLGSNGNSTQLVGKSCEFIATFTSGDADGGEHRKAFEFYGESHMTCLQGFDEPTCFQDLSTTKETVHGPGRVSRANPSLTLRCGSISVTLSAAAFALNCLW